MPACVAYFKSRPRRCRYIPLSGKGSSGPSLAGGCVGLPFGGLAVGLGGAVALLVAVGALVLVGNHHTRTKAGIVGRSPAHTATTPNGPPDCNAAGINDQQMREGTCVSGANTVVVVNKAGTLHLQPLDAKLVALHRSGTSAILTIVIQNKLRTPERWQHSMANLYVAGTDSGAGDSPFYDENLAPRGAIRTPAYGRPEPPLRVGSSLARLRPVT